MTGGASSCNVFWQVGSSATLDTDSVFVGSIMASESITATTGADISGRLLALNGAVTLDSNDVIAPAGCEVTTPTITSPALDGGTVGTPYDATITAEGTPTPTFTVTEGTLPDGLSLESETGRITGTPSSARRFTFEVTASNGTREDAAVTYELTIAAAVPAAAPTPTLAPAPAPAPAPASASARTVRTLANTGADGETLMPLLAGGLILSGALLVSVVPRRRRPAHRLTPTA